MRRDLLNECVHCGFCLPTCPTYVLWSEEMDSPRGRIYLMEALLDGTVRVSPTVVQHFDRCLGCVSCVTSCPSGVEYGRLIELAREHVEQNFERPLPERAVRSLIFEVLPDPTRMRAALALRGLGRLLPKPKALAPLLEMTPPWRSSAAPPELTAARGDRRARVGLLTGCVQRVVFGDVNVATARVLSAEGYEVLAPRDQACCGALHVHGGRLEEGRERARQLIESFERAGVDLVVVNAAGCGSAMKEYGGLLADDPTFADRAAAFSASVRDVSELLVADAPRAERWPLPLRVAYQDACHLLHAQGLREPPRQALATIPGLELAEPGEDVICCGSAGFYNLVQPDAARALGERKAERVSATGAQVYASANPGCLVQVTAHLRRLGRPLPALHPVELLDASIRATGADSVLASARR